MTTAIAKKKAVVENELLRVWPGFVKGCQHIERLRDLTIDDFTTGEWSFQTYETAATGGISTASRVLTLKDSLVALLMPWGITLHGTYPWPTEFKPEHFQVSCSRREPFDYRGIARDDAAGHQHKRERVQEELKRYVDGHRDTLFELTLLEVNRSISYVVDMHNRDYKAATTRAMTSNDNGWADEITGDEAEKIKRNIMDLKTQLEASKVRLKMLRNKSVLAMLEEENWTFEMPDGVTYQVAPSVASDIAKMYRDDKAFETRRFP